MTIWRRERGLHGRRSRILAHLSRMPMSPQKNSSTPPFVPLPRESSPDGGRAVPAADPAYETPTDRRPEIGGRPGPEPTRFGDWERNGRCIDF
jgi:hypothetical protein